MMNGWFHSAGSARELISIDHFVDDYIFATDQSAYGTTFRLVSGIDSECMSDEELAAVSARLLQALRLVPESCVLKQILIKRRGCEITPSRYEQSENKTVAETQAKRRRHLETRHLSTVELFWTLYIQPAALKGLTKLEEHGAANARRVRKLRNAVTVLKQSLSDITEIEQIDCHAVARLYGFISNLEPVLLPKRLKSKHFVARQLLRTKVDWLNDHLVIGRRHAKLFSLTHRPGGTRPNLFGELLWIDADLILVLETQRKSALETRKCINDHQQFLDLFRNSLLSMMAHFKSGKVIPKSANSVAADTSIDGLAGIVNDMENVGLAYTMTSMIGLLHSASVEELEEQMAQVHSVFGTSDASVLEEGLGSLSAYQAMFPAAARYGKRFNVRRFWLREDHAANLSLLYAPNLGERRSETLEDESLAVLETRQRTPFYFDHYSNGVCGILVLGKTGTGKTYWINHLFVDMGAKYGGFIFVFDYGRSYESTVLKYGGKVVRFGLDGPRLNPFSLLPTEESIGFVFRLVRMLLVKGGATVRPGEEKDLFERVRRMFDLEPEIRRLRHLVLTPNLQPYLDKWIGQGIYGRIFDNLHDELQFARIMAFDFQEVEGEQYADLMEPLLFWLRWHTQQITHAEENLGVPKLEIYEESWKNIESEDMMSMMLNTANTARKWMSGIVLATHETAQLGKYTRLIRNACSDTLFLGGPFDREEYRRLFRLNDRELDIIPGLSLGEGLFVREGQPSKILVNNVDAESDWYYTTRPKDRERRTKAIEKFGREEAFAQLVAANGSR